MRLILHLVGKDLRRLRGLLIAFAVAYTLPMWLGWMLTWEEPKNTYQWQQYISSAVVLSAINVLISFFAIVMLVHEDPVAGTRAFWLTRPIGGMRLLAAKGLTICVGFVLVPAALSVPWWWAAGFDLSRMGLAAFDLAIVAFAISALAMVVATLTDHLSRALLWTLVAFAAVGTGVAVFPLLAIDSGRGAVPIVRGAAVVVCAVLIGAAVVVWQYRTRRTAVGVTMLAVALVAVYAVGLRIPMRWRPAPLVEHDADLAKSVTVQLERATRRQVPYKSRRSLHEFELEFRAQGRPPGSILQGIEIAHAWELPGVTLRRSHPLHIFDSDAVAGFSAPPPDPATEEWRKSRALQRGVPYRPPGDIESGPRYFRVTTYDLPESVSARMLSEPPRYEASLWLQLLRAELRNEIPLRTGEWTRGRNTAARIHTTIPAPLYNTVVLVELEPATMLHMLKEAIYGHHQRTVMQLRRRGWFTINRSRMESYAATGGSSRDYTIALNGVVISWKRINAHSPVIRRDDTWRRRPGWLEEAGIGLFEFVEEARFIREVRSDALIVQDVPASRP